MEDNLEERVAILKKIIITLALYTAFGSVLLILGLYIKLSESQNFFHLLNDDVIINIMIGAGAFILIWSAPKVIGLYRGIGRIKKESTAQDQFNKLFRPHSGNSRSHK